MTVVTRFAPSPTGFLHIGGARTALFNWLFARHHGGRFRLRIEDTDRARSTDAAMAAIREGMAWLGLDHDGEIVYQSRRMDRHRAVVDDLLARGAAYRCYCTPEELEAMRAGARAAGRAVPYDRRWRDRDPADAPPGVAPVVRIRMPLDGETVLDDPVQGPVRIDHGQLDDFVLLRRDGTPTYMLAVVVDDHDMGVTHVIRGDDHLNNGVRQTWLFRACGWTPPVFAHIPLIHGPDGAKLSKRHGALGVEAYRQMGYLAPALRNYLLRLGWSHGDDEIIDTGQAIEWFDLPGVGKAPARMDMARLDHVNSHYLKTVPAAGLLAALEPFLHARLGGPPGAAGLERLARGLDGLRSRANTLAGLADAGLFYCRDLPLPFTDGARALLTGDGKALLASLAGVLETLPAWQADELDKRIRHFATARGEKLGQVARPLRAALCGATVSPGIFEVMTALGRDETRRRLAAATA